MNNKDREEHLLMHFLEHYEQHRETYKRWSREDVVKTFLETYRIHLFNKPVRPIFNDTNEFASGK
jgi:hypothetical protein